MTTRTDLDRSIAAWLVAEAPERAPQDLLEASRDQIRSTRQRRPLWPAGGTFPMSNFTRLAAGLIAVLAIAGAGIALRPLLNSAQPAVTPAVTPSPTPGAAGGPVVMDPGTYTTLQFRPAITYTVPFGWALVDDDANSFTIAPAAFTEAGITVCRNPRPGDKDAKPVSGVATDATSLATWFAGRPEVGVISGPTDWSQGGLTGHWFDLKGPSDGPEVNLMGYAGDGSGCGINMYPDQRIRVGFLDGPDSTLMVYVWDAIGSESYIETATRVIETYVFDVP
jgi:hypothetical protein